MWKVAGFAFVGMAAAVNSGSAAPPRYLWDDDAFTVAPPLPGKTAPPLPKKAPPTVRVSKPPKGREDAKPARDETRSETGTIFWLDHYSMKPTSASVRVLPVTEVPGSLDGLTVRSARGAVGAAPPWQGVEIAAGVPPGWRAVGVRVCWRLDDRRSHIRQVRIAQVEDPPESALVQLDADGWTERGPICATTERAFRPIDGSKGPLLVSLYLDLQDPKDRVVIRGIGLVLEPAPAP